MYKDYGFMKGHLLIVYNNFIVLCFLIYTAQKSSLAKSMLG